MKTTLGHGRSSFIAPTITVENSGSIAGGNNTYYFWLKAKNRVGFSAPSAVKSLVIANSRGIRISAANFAVNNWEDWKEFYIFASTTNDFSTSHVIYRQDVYEDDQYTPLTPVDVVITNNYVLNDSTFTVADSTSLPINVPNGFRVKVTSINKTYEYIIGSSKVVDNVTVIAATGGQWLVVKSNSLTETSTDCDLELYQIDGTTLNIAPLKALVNSPVGVMYYILNNTDQPITTGELTLNAYTSDPNLSLTYDVGVIGYLNISTNVLDTTDIQYVGTVINLPDTTLQLSKSLPANNALVIKVTPRIQLATDITRGAYITLYPRILPYTTINEVGTVGDAVLDLATLKSLAPSQYENLQTRFVLSKKADYYFDSSSTEDDDGETILIPNSNPSSGRWLVKQFLIQAGSITEDKLDATLLNEFAPKIRTTSISTTNETTLTISLDTSDYDYFILTAPNNSGETLTINVTATLANNQTKALILELRQLATGVLFDSSILFPGGTVPTLSGNGKTDLFVIELVRDSSGTLKKRAFLVQKDIG